MRQMSFFPQCRGDCISALAARSGHLLWIPRAKFKSHERLLFSCWGNFEMNLTCITKHSPHHFFKKTNSHWLKKNKKKQSQILLWIRLVTQKDKCGHEESSVFFNRQSHRGQMGISWAFPSGRFAFRPVSRGGKNNTERHYTTRSDLFFCFVDLQQCIRVFWQQWASFQKTPHCELEQWSEISMMSWKRCWWAKNKLDIHSLLDATQENCEGLYQYWGPGRRKLLITHGC